MSECDPCFLICSERKRANRAIFESIGIWREDQERSLNAAFNLPRSKIFLMRYEDLVTDPHSVLMALCGFLGIEYEPGMLSFHESRSAKRAGELHPVVWQNLQNPLMSDNTKLYVTRPGGLEVRRIELELRDLMLCLGYHPDYEEPGSLTRFLLKLRCIAWYFQVARRWYWGRSWTRTEYLVPVGCVAYSYGNDVAPGARDHKQTDTAT